MTAAVTQTAAQMWRFEALDTWFFRESRPMESGGGAQLGSVFPPPARTLIGAIRTTLGDAQQVDWQAYARDPAHPLRRLIGTPDELQPLRFQGAYLTRHGERLYPVPLVLLQARVSDQTRYTRLEPGKQPVDCDLGRVYLPVKREALPGAKPLEGAWLTRTGLEAVLQGQVPRPDAVLAGPQLFAPEPRLGIALEAQARRPIDGMLYQTRHLRLAEGIGAGITVDGLDEAGCGRLGRQGVARVGGEGRLATWSRQAAPALPACNLGQKARRFMLCLLTPARFAQGWLPDGFRPQTTPEGLNHWVGTLAGRPARLLCAVTGKPVREGGWNMVDGRARDLHARVPAGSCYFIEFDSSDDAQAAARACHGSQIGQDTAWGAGQIAVGAW